MGGAGELTVILVGCPAIKEALREVLSFSFKATWFYVTLGAAIYLFLHPGCETPSLDIPLVLSISIIGFMVVQLAGIINDSIIMAISNLGSLSNFEPRKKIEIFVCIGAIIYFTEVSWDIYSTYSVFSPHVTAEQITNCSSYATALKIYQGVILSHWGIVIFLFLLYLFWLDPFHLVHLTSRPQQFEDDLAELEKTRRKEYPAHPKRGVHSNAISCIIWLKQCCKKRGISTPRQQALRDLANAFEMLFEGIEDMDYTFLDIVSGFKLMSVYHEKLRERNKDPAELIIKTTVDVLKTDDTYDAPSDPIKLEGEELQKYIVDMKYYLDYAMASYGWPIHVYRNPCTGPASLCISARCNCCCARCKEPHFEGNVCFPNEAAIKAMTGVSDDDIVTASFVNAVHIVPFYVVKVERDNQKEVIIAIRGTLSIKDALTDVSACMVEVEDDLLGVHPSYIHRGFYQAALGIYEHLLGNEDFKELAISKRYRIVLTGHSLGAAVSSVLAVLLKHNHPEWTENLTAFNFATPAVFNYPLAKKTDEFMISVVSGYDVVPRMCVRGLGHLILSIDDLIKNCKHTKQSVLCCRGCCGWELDIDVDVIEARQEDTLRELKLPKTESDDKDDDDDKDGNEVDGGGHSEHSSLTRAGHHSKNKPKIGMKILRLLAQMVATRGAEEERPPMMFTPGRIIHLELEEEDTVKKWFSCGLKKAGRVKATVKAREDLSGIQIHTSMLLDHGPTRTIDYIHTLHDQLQ